MSAQPTITAKVTASKPGRPPLMRLTLDVALANPTDAPRWFIVAKQIPPDDGAGGGVDSVELRGAGVAVVGTFFGTGGFHAVRLAAHSKATITNLAVGWWQSSPTAVMPGLDVVVADDLRLGGQPASAWFGVEPLLGDGATLDAGGDAKGGHQHEGGEAAVELVGATPSNVALAP